MAYKISVAPSKRILYLISWFGRQRVNLAVGIATTALCLRHFHCEEMVRSFIGVFSHRKHASLQRRLLPFLGRTELVRLPLGVLNIAESKLSWCTGDLGDVVF